MPSDSKNVIITLVVEVFEQVSNSLSYSKFAKCFVLAYILVSLQGCGDATLQRLSQELTQTCESSPAKVQKFYVQLNSENQQMDGKELKLSSVPELQGIDLPNPGNFIDKYDSDRVIKPRVKMAEMLTVCATEIDKIANAKTQAAVDEVITDSNATLKKIGGDLLGIQAIASNLPIGSITALMEPIKTLSSLGLQGVFGFLRENAARDLINKIDTSFEDVCTNMVRDLNNSADQTKERARNIAHLHRILLDKKLKQNVSEEERDKLLKDQNDAGTYANNVAANNPPEVFERAKELIHKLALWAAEKAKAQSNLKQKLMPWKHK